MSANGWPRAEGHGARKPAQRRPDSTLYGDHDAACYDAIYPRLDPRIVPCVEALAAGRPVLELGVGTGRLALPLKRRAVPVLGVDASAAMLRRLRVRDPAHGCELVQADLAALPLVGPIFGVAVALTDTLALLPDRSAQQACLLGVAATLAPLGWLLHEGTTCAQDVQPEWLDVPWNGAQPGSYRCRCLPLPPAVLDDLAATAGLRPVARWADWTQRDWQPGQPMAISLYRKPDC